MKNLDTKLRAIELRAEGNSLNTIALLGVRRQTLADWLVECQEEVENLKAIELDALREAFLISKRERLEQMTARLKQITAEIEKRGFSDVPTEKLLQLEEETHLALENECSGADLRSERELKAAEPGAEVEGLRPFAWGGGIADRACHGRSPGRVEVGRCRTKARGPY